MFTRSFGLLLVAPLFCLGCDTPASPDARQAQFVGTWKEVYQGPKSILTLKADGTYTAFAATPREYRMLFHAPATIDIKGTWKTTEGEIHFHIDEASAMEDTFVGRDARESINNVNESWFTTTDAKNHEIMYNRVDEATEGALEMAKESVQRAGEGK